MQYWTCIRRCHYRGHLYEPGSFLLPQHGDRPNNKHFVLCSCDPGTHGLPVDPSTDLRTLEQIIGDLGRYHKDVEVQAGTSRDEAYFKWVEAERLNSTMAFEYAEVASEELKP